jgi:lipoate-protein ligase A
MLFVDNERTIDPRLNLAIEEHLLRNLETDEDVLLFYVNEPSIIIGRYQNTIEEVNRDYVQAQGIHVVRRVSGGGAVYHDLGNLNFSFITDRATENIHNFKKFTAPVIAVLRTLGVPAELGGRNDILAGGRKISGNAQYITKKRMVSHGTLLVHSDLERVTDALKVKPGKIESKGIKSVRSRVANINEFLAEPLEVEALRQRLLQGIFSGVSEIPQYRLTEADWAAIHSLAVERYLTWEWNWGRSPDFNVQKTKRFAVGEIDARIDVQNGHIQSIRFTGDFFSQNDPGELEAMLTGARYDLEGLAAALEGVEVENTFPGLTRQDLVDFLY